ncbi:MAG: peptide chain release factor N(5)-glutamine methyltransferase [Propionibacteriaceae bacterium]|jgi:release factor glutamine methyltransferase|nr:peptide chain release factor N(5)-glutamine methyltransferase [Propionibacteriaceae bacterium]
MTRPAGQTGLVASAAGGPTLPVHEARALKAFVLGLEPSMPLSASLDAEQRRRYDALAARRRDGEPLQYLTGRAYFRTIEVSVRPGVFIPRPETEVMVGWALDRLGFTQSAGSAVGGRTTERTAADGGGKARAMPAEIGGDTVEDGGGADALAPVVVELCAGSGAVSLALWAETGAGLRQYAVEIDPLAWDCAQANLVGTGVDLRLGDMADAFPELDGQADLVIANPPYVPLSQRAMVAGDVLGREPDLALFSGVDGLDAIRLVAEVAARLLRPGGAVCCEHAESNAEGAVDAFARRGEFGGVEDHHDLTRRPRFVTALRR